MIYIGLDISSSSTGIAVLNPAEKLVSLHSVIRRSHTRKFNEDIHPYMFTKEIIEFISNLATTKVIKRSKLIAEIYRPAKGKYTSGQWVVPWIQGFIISALYSKYNKMPEWVSQSVWKHNLTNRKTYGKEFVEDSFHDVININNWASTKTMAADHYSYEDALDAFGIAYYGYSKYDGS